MGSANSRLRSRSKRSIMSSFLCGASSSRTSPEVGDVSDEHLVSSADLNNLVNNDAQVPPELWTSPGIRSSSTGVETRSRNQHAASERAHNECDQGVVQKNDLGKCVHENSELFPSHQVSHSSSHNESYRDSDTRAASTAFKECQSSAPNSVNDSANKNAMIGVDGSVNKDVSQNYPEVAHSSTSCLHGSQDSHSDRTPINNNDSELTQYPNLNSSPEFSGLEVTLQLPGNRSSRGALPSHLGLIVSDRDSVRGDGSLLQVDMVSISSNISSGSNADSSNREFRRNSRRVFWDAFSRRSSRRFMDSPTFMNATDDTDDLGSQDRWLLEFDHDRFHDETNGDSGYLGSRMHNLSERRRHARSEIWGRLHGSLNESTRQSYCPTGLHPDGSCSCENFMMSGDSSASSSISRIVMLAEALFEVLDEIHRQPGSLSLSISRPAPASVVDSLPLKSHKKVNIELSGSDDVAQCYICLADYEDEDKIRVLPCRHEFHMSCVDKWLKEIHGVCPLCRGEVREDVSKSSSSPGTHSI